ncbi:MAG: glycoside hydrolase family 31 protein [Fimbriimonas sp.]|nr:glycoside hydrolase family 31 protein [Fimbriimonas sp.]
MRVVTMLVFALPSLALAAPYTITAGNVRIQVLSPHLVRLEEKGPMGFEDRQTFTVVNRDFAKTRVKVQKRGGVVTLLTDDFAVTIPEQALSLRDVQVLDGFNQPLYQYNGTPPPTQYLPAPGFMKPAWVMADSPRLVPPAWGATPAPKNVDPALAAKSGWDDRNNAPDIYVFVPGRVGYAQLRRDFLALTGPIPKPPLFILGFIDSRWYPYSEKEALQSIDTYRSKGIPLDTFVVDTDWRVNGSAGYAVEPKYFPDMPRFIDEAHKKHVRLMFNDHPDPKAPTATDPKELAFRWEGLTKLLNWGMDVWWYDRNWSTSLHEPMPGIRKEVWGQRLYHDITERARPEQRPWIMTNAQGIDNGFERYPPQPAGHRYPMMWTGDTGSRFDFLKRGVENGVDRGVLALQPYTHEDLGGHTGPTPSPELYIRYLEYGCLSPITRVHCTLGQDRHPWAYGPEAEQIVSNYIKLRYRLLPTIYSAAQHACDDGTPILRRCDLYWPTFPEAAHNDQYLFGDDLLVAPITSSMNGDPTPIPSSMLRTPLGAPGLRAEYFDNDKLEGEPKLVRTDDKIDFDWGDRAPADGIPQEHFSARWTGILGPVPTAGEYRITTKNDDGVRVYIDGRLVVDDWKAEDTASNTATVSFEAGSTHTFRVEYMQLTGGALCTVGWLKPSEEATNASKRSVWIPPGVWQDLWTGRTITGPKTITATAELGQVPMWVASGALVFTGPDLQYTGERVMDPMTVDAYPLADGTNERELVEDDGLSNEYLKGSIARTKIDLASSGVYAAVRLGGTKGSYAGIKEERNWVVRIHLPKGLTATKVTVDSKPIPIVLAHSHPVTIPFQAGAAPEEGQVVTVALPKTSIRKEHTVLVETK